VIPSPTGSALVLENNGGDPLHLNNSGAPRVVGADGIEPPTFAL
jgi:hypothetical protein